MKRYLFFFPLLSLFLAPNLQAQQVEFAPTGAEWFYSYQSSWGTFQGFFHAQSLGDTLLNGRVCKKICTSYYSQPATPPYCQAQSSVRYLYQRADSIFECQLDPAAASRLLFRTDFQVGDSMYYLYRAFVVTNIDTFLLNNQPIRRFHLDDGLGTKPIVYDRFGPKEGLFDYSWGVIADGDILHLRCYEDSHFPQVHLTNEACDFVLSAGEPLFGLHIYPNPAHDFIYLTFQGATPSNIQVQIWDAAGRLVRDRTALTNQAIDVKTLPAGFYVLNIEVGETRAQRRFVKQ